MNKVFILISFIGLNCALSALANVGGGDAEMKIGQMAPAAAVWAKACNENAGLCGDVGVFTATDAKALSLAVGFAPAGAGLQTCGASQVTLAQEDLYVDGQKSKPEMELAQMMTQQMLFCGGWRKFRLRKLNFDQLLPVARKLSEMPFAALTGRNTDVLVALESPLNAQEMLTTAMSCKNVRIGAAETNGFHVQCLDDQNKSLVLVRNDGIGFRFVAKPDSANY
ncbi:MAG: hypothetical protein H7326_06905 [Bdellovibrionaceae bacterium]|nr:hypothetical protein [Pseudobdellovibrionaceae bacterium]